MSEQALIQNRKRIAIVGSAPSSAAMAPYDDDSWLIWACSPGAVAHVRRVDAWFELHRWAVVMRNYPDYVAFLAALDVPVFTVAPPPMVPRAVAYPMHEVVEEFGKYFFSSSIAWMLALAIRQQPEEIGVFGVDMAAATEYVHQKPGCHYFVQVAQQRGIKVTVPPESDLLAAPPLYGFSEVTARGIKLNSKRAELEGRIAEHQKARQEHHDKVKYLEGALNMIGYFERTW